MHIFPACTRSIPGRRMVTRTISVRERSRDFISDGSEFNQVSREGVTDTKTRQVKIR